MARAERRFIAGMVWLGLAGMAEAGEPTPKQHKWDECEVSLHSDQDPKAVVVVRAARCFMDLGIYTRAAHVLTKQIDEMDEQGAQGGRTVIENLLQQALSAVAVLDIKTENGASLLIDGVVVGTLPAANPVFLKPGEHVIEARLDDRQTQKHVEVVPGHVGNLELLFEPKKAVVPKESPQSPRILPDKPSKSNWPAWQVATTIAGGIVGAVGLGAGTAYVLSAQSADEERTTMIAGFPLHTSQCALDATTAPCTQVARLVEKRNNAYGIAVGGFVAGGIGATVLAAAILAPKQRSSSIRGARNMTAAFVPNRDGAMVWLGGIF